jgi:hypothetical protein
MGLSPYKVGQSIATRLAKLVEEDIVEPGFRRSEINNDPKNWIEVETMEPSFRSSRVESKPHLAQFVCHYGLSIQNV